MQDRCVLVVDDDPQVRRLVESFLTSDGLSVDAVETIDEAADLLRRAPGYCCAIVDFWLEGEDATRLLDLLRSDWPDLPVILISGGRQDVSLERTQAIGDMSGVLQFLAKPFNEAELTQLVRKLIKDQQT